MTDGTYEDEESQAVGQSDFSALLCGAELSGDYYADCNLLINEISRLRKGISDITKMQPKVLSNFEPIETLAMSPTELIRHVHKLLS